MKFVAELTEREATGEKARIYAEIRRLGAVPMVALIFRHLATLPGALEWAWDAISPAWRGGSLQRQAWQIAGQTRAEPITPIPREALAALGIDAAGLAEIRTVARAYNLANPVNLLSVSCLSRLLAGGQASRAATQGEWQPPQAPGPIPPMIDVAGMPRTMAELLYLVSESGAQGGTRLVPSLYRHFGHRPEFLALLVTLLLPRYRDGQIRQAVASIRSAMEAGAADLVQTLSAPPAPDPAIGAAFERFGPVIPEMIVVGTLLEQALPVD